MRKGESNPESGVLAPDEMCQRVSSILIKCSWDETGTCVLVDSVDLCSVLTSVEM